MERNKHILLLYDDQKYAFTTGLQKPNHVFSLRLIDLKKLKNSSPIKELTQAYSKRKICYEFMKSKDQEMINMMCFVPINREYMK